MCKCVYRNRPNIVCLWFVRWNFSCFFFFLSFAVAVFCLCYHENGSDHVLSALLDSNVNAITHTHPPSSHTHTSMEHNRRQTPNSRWANERFENRFVRSAMRRETEEVCTRLDWHYKHVLKLMCVCVVEHVFKSDLTLKSLNKFLWTANVKMNERKAKSAGERGIPVEFRTEWKEKLHFISQYRTIHEHLIAFHFPFFLVLSISPPAYAPSGVQQQIMKWVSHETLANVTQM